MKDHFTLHIRGVGHWTNKLNQLFEDEYKKQTEQTSHDSVRGGASALKQRLNGLKATMKRSFNSWNETRREKRERNESGLGEFAEYMKEHEAEALKKRREERMKKRETKLNQIKLELEDHKGETKSFRKHLNMRNAKSVRYKPVENEPAQSGSNPRKLVLPEPLEIFVDGPFGSPSSNIYRAEHAVLIGTGIGKFHILVTINFTVSFCEGITPFASILQSIMHRYWSSKTVCPQCSYSWTSENITNMFNLRKVDFFWINRDHTSFEWFVNLLSQLEIEQQEQGGHMKRFLDMHMYVTSALQRNDMKAVALQMALDILHKKEERDLITGKYFLSQSSILTSDPQYYTSLRLFYHNDRLNHKSNLNIQS